MCWNICLSIKCQTRTHVKASHFCKRLCWCRWRSNVIYLVTRVIGAATTITCSRTRDCVFFVLQWCYLIHDVFSLPLCLCVHVYVYVCMATPPSLHVCVAMRSLAAPANAQIVHSGAACNVKDDNISERIYTIKEGDTLVLQCIVKGHPRPQVSSQTACWWTVTCWSCCPDWLSLSEQAEFEPLSQGL